MFWKWKQKGKRFDKIHNSLLIQLNSVTHIATIASTPSPSHNHAIESWFTEN